jgi:hypothetical protein
MVRSARSPSEQIIRDKTIVKSLLDGGIAVSSAARSHFGCEVARREWPGSAAVIRAVSSGGVARSHVLGGCAVWSRESEETSGPQSQMDVGARLAGLRGLKLKTSPHEMRALRGARRCCEERGEVAKYAVRANGLFQTRSDGRSACGALPVLGNTMWWSWAAGPAVRRPYRGGAQAPERW